MIGDMKHLATALKLASKFDRVDHLAADWIERGMREKKAEDFEEASERREWYDLRDSWEKATRDLQNSVNKFMQETGYSPILRYAREGDTGKVYLGLDTPQAKGYRILELTFPQWFEELNLQSENKSEDQVLKLVSVERLSPEQERQLRESFVEDLREAGVEKYADYMARYEAAVDRRKTYNENVFRVDDLVETIKNERALAIPRPTPLAVPEKPPERPPEGPPPTPPAPAPTAPPPAPLGLSEEQKVSLQDAFRRVFEEASVKDVPMATFRDELTRLQEDLQTVERTRAYKLAYSTIVDVAAGLLPKRPRPVITPPIPAPAPPTAPPVSVPPVEMLGPRRRDIITVQCWVPTCLNQCIVDKDLMRRVTLTPVLKGWSPRGARYEPLLPLPPLFFYSCEEHKEERFGYRSIYDALAYLLFESRSSTKRMTITKGTLADVGLDQEDINTIQAAEARWIP